MDFQFTFQQAYIDRLEDAGVKRYGYQNHDGYVLPTDDQPKRKTPAQHIRRAFLATAQALVK